MKLAYPYEEQRMQNFPKPLVTETYKRNRKLGGMLAMISKMYGIRIRSRSTITHHIEER